MGYLDGITNIFVPTNTSAPSLTLNQLGNPTTSPLNGSTPPDSDTKTAIRQIPPASSSRVPNKMTTAVAQPVSGQANDPLYDSDPIVVSTDGYRNGDPSSDNNETYNSRTLASNDEDQISFMTLRMVDPSVPLYDPNALSELQTDDPQNVVSAYSRFFLQAVSEVEQEKYQVVETFTGYYAFFYGKRPPIYRYAGTLLCDPNYRWNNDFKFFYENYFRGTRATELNAELIMYTDGRLVTGFPLSLSMSQEAMNDKGIPFSMDLLVVDHTPLNFSLDIADLIAQQQADLSGR